MFKTLEIKKNIESIKRARVINVKNAVYSHIITMQIIAFRMKIFSRAISCRLIPYVKKLNIVIYACDVPPT